MARYIALLLIADTLHAETYRCTVNGQSIYSDVPCATNAQRADALQDRPTEQQQRDRVQQTLKERQQRNRIEARENQEYAARDRALARQLSVEASAAAEQRRRCAVLQNEIQSNQRSVARYQDFGWQNSLNQQESELKRNRENYERNCR